MAAIQPSGLNFSTVGEQISYFMGHIARDFIGGASGSGENGIDVSMPMHTPVYAVESGTVKGAGYYGGGGVVSIESAPNRVWYYQHLDEDVVVPGQQIPAGQLIGWSGGQNTGGNHPASPEFSSFQHIEIGIDAPWKGIWGGGENVVNGVPESIDPKPELAKLMLSQHDTPTFGGPQGSSTDPLSSTTSTATGGTAVPAFIAGLMSSLGIPNVPDLLWRTGLIVTGLLLILIGFMIMFAHQEEEAGKVILPMAAKAAAV